VKLFRWGVQACVRNGVEMRLALVSAGPTIKVTHADRAICAMSMPALSHRAILPSLRS
jgi:hypothetical protein